MYNSLKPVLLAGSLQDSFLVSFALGWLITHGAGLASYPNDIVRRRMMMTSGEAVKYKSAFTQIQIVVQGWWCKHSACCGWCWYPCWVPQASGHRIRKEVWFRWGLI